MQSFRGRRTQKRRCYRSAIDYQLSGDPFGDQQHERFLWLNYFGHRSCSKQPNASNYRYWFGPEGKLGIEAVLVVKKNTPNPRGEKLWTLWVWLYSQAFEQLAVRVVVHALRMNQWSREAILPSKINWVRPFSNKLTVDTEVNGGGGTNAIHNLELWLHLYRALVDTYVGEFCTC